MGCSALITLIKTCANNGSARFSNHSGRDQLSQVGSQMNIITSRHELLYN